MKIKDIEQFYFDELKPFYPIVEVRNFVLLILNHLRNYERKDIIINDNSDLTDNEYNFVAESLRRLKENEPIQYIIGNTFFCDLKFFTDKRALIPRPETEELMYLILSENKNPLSILDIGTGSGCIAISLKHNLPTTEVTAWDVSKDAISLAQKNADFHNLHINFEEIDVLSVKNIDKKFDVIVSNPPYVTPLDKEQMHENVLKFEPHLALFVEQDNPLIFYKKIADLGRTMLNNGGKLYFEINENYGKETVEFLNQMGYKSIVLIKDLSGRHRIIRAVWEQ